MSNQSSPLLLQSRQSPLLKFILIGAFALLWTSLVAFFVWDALKEMSSAGPELIALLFLAPFIAVAIVLIVLAIRNALALTNPRITIALANPTVAVGDTLRIGWIFPKNSHRIQKLTLRLDGREEATYRRGTNKHTDHCLFHREILVETSDPSTIREGRCEALIPPDLIHTFHADSNHVLWVLVVRAYIARWPDVHEDFEINVLPPRQPQ